MMLYLHASTYEQTHSNSIQIHHQSFQGSNLYEGKTEQTPRAEVHVHMEAMPSRERGRQCQTTAFQA